jgi:anti-anti-sigma regulatory factor
LAGFPLQYYFLTIQFNQLNAYEGFSGRGDYCMKVLCELSGERVVLSTGTMLISGSAMFRSFETFLRNYSRRQSKELVIDFRECVYLDSHAISLIITAHRRLRLGGTRLVIHNANDDITELLQAIQINKIIEMV